MTVTISTLLQNKLKQKPRNWSVNEKN